MGGFYLFEFVAIKLVSFACNHLCVLYRRGLFLWGGSNWEWELKSSNLLKPDHISACCVFTQLFWIAIENKPRCELHYNRIAFIPFWWLVRTSSGVHCTDIYIHILCQFDSYLQSKKKKKCLPNHTLFNIIRIRLYVNSYKLFIHSIQLL